MDAKIGYDYLNWTSVPSSAKIVNDTETWVGFGRDIPSLRGLAVIPGSKLRVEINVKQKDVFNIDKSSHFALDNFPLIRRIGVINIPIGTFDWRTVTTEIIIPEDVATIRGYFAGGANGTSWFDDLRLYQDDELIYKNKFSDWKPVGAAAGAIIGGIAGGIYNPIGSLVSPLVGALGGAGLGYGAGYAADYTQTPLKGLCPVCGVKVADKPLGEDVRCENCGFVSAYTR